MIIPCPDAAQRHPKHFLPGVVFILVACGFLAGCQQLQPGTKKSPEVITKPVTSVPADDGLIHQLAQVESVAAQVSPLDATKADITISGLLHDGATQVQDIQHQKLADGFVITVTTARPKHATASLALIPFDRTISVSIDAMPKGLCKVMVNGVATTFMIP